MANREVLKNGSVIVLQNSFNPSQKYEFVISDFLGKGSSAVCYKAIKHGINGEIDISGTLKEFYPFDDPENDHIAYNIKRNYSQNKLYDNQLVLVGNITEDNFVTARDDYLNSVKKVAEIRSKNKDLFSKIPTFEEYTGITETGCPPTYYLWFPYEVEAATFDNVLNLINGDTVKGKRKLENLLFILRSIKNLAKAVNLMHDIGLYHLDIAPKNFGLLMENEKPTELISLIDFNTFYSFDSGKILFRGSSGFRSPYFATMTFDMPEKTFDIFSIGACLFFALVVEKDSETLVNRHFIDTEKDSSLIGRRVLSERFKKYFRERLDSIDSLISSSLLFQNCDETQDRVVQKNLCNILRNCFDADAANAYKTLTAFVADIENVIKLLEVSAGVKNSHNNSGRILEVSGIDKEEYVQRFCTLGINAAIQNLLYNKPLFNYVSSEKSVKETNGTDYNTADNAKLAEDIVTEYKPVNILLFGGGLFSSKFIDVAAQLLQVSGLKAHFTVASNTPETDKQKFLEIRKEYPDYFDIDSAGAKKEPEDPYAYIDFVKIEFNTAGDEEINKDRLSTFCKQQGNKDFRYIFVAMHSDRLNYKIAKTAQDYFGSDGRVFSYVVFGDKNDDDTPVIDLAEPEYSQGNLIPLDIYFEKNDSYRLLEQMAFNVHLLWSSSLSDIVATKAKFESKDYEKLNSMANAVSVQYKLKSIGIDPDYKNIESVADAAYEKLSDKKTVDELVMYEHRRWNIEIMSEGWTLLEKKDYGVLTNATKDEDNHRHPCLLPSRIKTDGDKSQLDLKDNYWTECGRKNWDNPDKDKLDALDDLDRMSVNLHKHFYDIYIHKDIKRDSFDVNVSALKKLSAGDKELENICDAFINSVYAFFNADENEKTDQGSEKKKQINFYKYYLNRFSKLFKEKKTKTEISDFDKETEAIKEKLFPILSAFAFTDFKAKDETIIKNIPFILTYSTDKSIATPLRLSENESDATTLFNNVASLIWINPQRVVYTVLYSELKKKYENALISLEYALAVMKNHGLQTSTELMILAPVEEKEEAEVLSKRIKEKFNTVSAYVREYKSDEDDADDECDEFDATESLRKYFLDHRSGAKCISAVEMPEGTICNLLTYSDAKKSKFPCFVFNSEQQSFEKCTKGSHFVKYIPFRPSVYVDDIFLAKGIFFRNLEPQLYREYKYVWDKIYKTAPFDIVDSAARADIWKAFCSFMTLSSDERIFTVSAKDISSKIKNYSYRFPQEYKLTFEKVMSAFQREEFIKSFSINWENSYTVKMDMSACEKINKKVKLLLEKCSIFLSDADKLTITKTDEGLVVGYNSLLIAFDINKAEKDILRTAYKNIIDKLDKENIICGRASKSFVCTSPMVKKLITDSEYILKLYVYYNLIETGYFDEVRFDVVFNVNDSCREKVDIIAVKGFRTLIISCHIGNNGKIIKILCSELMNNNSLGVNSTGILIADTITDETALLKSIEEVIGFAKVKGICRNENLYLSENESKDVGTSVKEIMEKD